jgi:hypothetical protein
MFQHPRFGHQYNERRVSRQQMVVALRLFNGREAALAYEVVLLASRPYTAAASSGHRELLAPAKKRATPGLALALVLRPPPVLPARLPSPLPAVPATSILAVSAA